MGRGSWLGLGCKRLGRGQKRRIWAKLAGFGLFLALLGQF
jgi:hypothetical protein